MFPSFTVLPFTPIPVNLFFPVKSLFVLFEFLDVIQKTASISPSFHRILSMKMRLKRNQIN